MRMRGPDHITANRWGGGGAFITEETSRVSSVIKTLPVSGFWHAGIYYHFNNPGKTANQCSVN